MLLYRQTPGHFFYFDDFDFLSTPIPASIQQLVAPLSPFRSNIHGWYRPLTASYYFVGYRMLFGLDPVPFMLTNLATLLANVLLVFLLVERITAQPLTGAIAAHLYGVNLIHFETMSWAAGFQEQALALFCLGALLAYLRWAEREPPASSRRWLRLASIISYLLALLSKETAVMLPGWLALHFAAVHVGRLEWRVFVQRLLVTQWPYYVTSLIYLTVRWWAISSRAASDGVYAFKGGLTAVTHYVWFTRWALDEFLYPARVAKTVVAPNAHVGWLAWLSLGLLAVLSFTAAVALSASPLLRRKVGFLNSESCRATFLGLAWFVVGLLPVSLPASQAAYYLVLPAVGAYLAAACILRGILAAIAGRAALGAIAVGLVIWAGTAWGAFDRVAALEANDVPMFGRSIRQAIGTLQTTHPDLPPHATVYLLDFPEKMWPGESAERSISLYYGGVPIRAIVGTTSEVQLGRRDLNVYVLRYENGRTRYDDAMPDR